MTDQVPDQSQPLRVMAIYAHPDDPEFFSGGALARWASEGADVSIVLATSGDKGSEVPDMTHERLIAIREEEERNAAKALGAKEVIFLRYPDGELQPTLQLRKELTRLIRMKKPDIVVTCDPTVFWMGTTYINHPDHRAIGTATIEAVFPTARDRLNFIEMERDEGLTTHKVKYVYLAVPNEPTVNIDITAHIETKIASLREHKSQIADMEGMATRVRERSLDPQSPPDAPRHIERYRVFTLA
ncbi:MAG TPA: PIG-L family deacetylase [Aggregatilineales bacterium]|nr:PIG-L family deacetylase [Aggregatilineales bacterium]